MNNTVVSGAITLGVMGSILLSFHFTILRLKKKSSCAPSAGNSRCAPGESQLAQIDDLSGEIRVCSLALIVIPILLFCTHMAYSFFGRQPETLGRTAISVAGALVLFGYFLWKLNALRSDRRLVRLAYEGKVAAGEALNRLSADGYRIIHDFSKADFSIDHLAVGPTGVMAVKTETRQRNRRHGRDGDAVVRYDGRMLHFPKYSDFETIEQANAQAEWLSQWLSSEVGEDVCARAMVALPGWSVKRTSADGMPVVNPKQFETLFKYLKPRPMPERLMQRIVLLIENCYRDKAL
ncbi:MAG: nuclease-related domain-containing protein [Desulfobacteraceae bacterium]